MVLQSLQTVNYTLLDKKNLDSQCDMTRMRYCLVYLEIWLTLIRRLIIHCYTYIFTRRFHQYC